MTACILRKSEVGSLSNSHKIDTDWHRAADTPVGVARYKICNHSLSVTQIPKLYDTLALPVLLYGSETWTVKASDARRITAAEMKYMIRTAGYTWDRLQNKCTNCKGVKNNTNFGQITGIQEKLDTTCK